MKRSKTVITNPEIFRNEVLFIADEPHPLPLSLALLKIKHFLLKRKTKDEQQDFISNTAWIHD